MDLNLSFDMNLNTSNQNPKYSSHKIVQLGLQIA